MLCLHKVNQVASNARVVNAIVSREILKTLTSSRSVPMIRQIDQIAEFKKIVDLKTNWTWQNRDQQALNLMKITIRQQQNMQSVKDKMPSNHPGPPMTYSTSSRKIQIGMLWVLMRMTYGTSQTRLWQRSRLTTRKLTWKFLSLTLKMMLLWLKQSVNLLAKVTCAIVIEVS